LNANVLFCRLFKKKSHPVYDQTQGSGAVFTGIKFVQGWYYLKSLPSWYWYMSGIAWAHTALVGSLLSVVIGVVEMPLIEHHPVIECLSSAPQHR